MTVSSVSMQGAIFSTRRETSEGGGLVGQVVGTVVRCDVIEPVARCMLWRCVYAVPVLVMRGAVGLPP